ncbi:MULTISPECIES: hypothetical protein [Kitasatospora]|jgi:hypothetical protein|uniref:hypothetical protein n=1 Tax=Kitasatospora TaxID=2063 RepID=UPI000C7022B0|nr:hypothetical protein [Kitasatospora sp. GP30]MDH6144845.1 hypothetical protein [Kitasatospora sp. GP30]
MTESIMESPAAEAPQFYLDRVLGRKPGMVAVAARTYEEVREGDRFRRTTPDGREVELVLLEIHKYRGVRLPQLEAGHGCGLVLSGPDADQLPFTHGEVVTGERPA